MKKKKIAKAKKSTSVINKLYDAIVKTALKLEKLLKQYEKAKDKKPTAVKKTKKKAKSKNKK
jgi:hypothetical protein